MVKRLAIVVVIMLSACASKRLVVPDDMRAKPVKKAERPSILPAIFGGSDATAREASSDPAPPAAAPYRLRVAEGGRLWEFEIPADSGAYEMRIPLGAGGPVVAPTLADRQLMSASPAGDGPDRSYLVAMAKVGEMYRDGRYELALIEVAELEKAFPREPRIHAMKGSLYRRLGKVKLARESWEQALALDPEDVVVAEALRSTDGAER